MNASFGVKDSLQLLQTLADILSYESASICKAVVANYSKQLIELDNTLDKGKGKAKARLDQTMSKP